MSHSMEQITCRISECPSVQNCWGSVLSTCGKSIVRELFPRPTIVRCIGKPKIMIITEQPNVNLKALKEWKNEWNPTERFVSEFENCHPFFRDMNKLMNERLYPNYDKSKKAFHSYYWTHFIKCSGRIRSIKEFKTTKKCRLDKNACADHFLLDELKELRPKTVIAIGEHANRWLLKKASNEINWKDVIWNELEQVILKKRQKKEIEIENLKFELFTFVHPSRQNPERWLNDKLKILLKDLN